MPSHAVAGFPPPLPRAPLPRALRWRLLAWRGRFVVAAACIGVATSAALHVVDPPPARTVPVVVTAHAVEAGAALGRADVRVAHLPAGLAPSGAATAVSGVDGASTAVPLGAGTPLVPGVLAPRDVRGPAGTVVASVRFADQAAARLLVAGMRVDVLAATVEGATGRTVARRALVLPTPASAVASSDDGGLLGGPTSDDADAPPVLLAVTPDEATAIAGASASALLSAVVVP
jgi:Flp pilus assembly protein CpaB